MKFLAFGKNKLLELATGITATTKGLVSGQLVHDYITAKILEAVPVGEVCMFWGDTVPSGFLLCNGGLVSKTTYSRLYASKGAAWTQTTDSFYLPAMAGRFPKGSNGAMGGGNSVGTYEEDAIRNISGGIGFYANSYAGLYAERIWGAISARSAGEEGGVRPVLNSTTGETSPGVVVEMMLSAHRAVPTADENRPKNISLLFGIKY